MGILADIYISQDNEAAGYDTTPGQFAERAQYKGFTPLELSMLWSIMRNAQWDVALMGKFTCLLEKDDGERQIHSLPAEMVTDLSRLTADQIADLSSQWAVTEELGWPPEAAREVIEGLVRLTRRAAESGRKVYLWNCV